ncbi:MAG: lipopolysaccharide assembly protein LapB [Gammaproteobacteria bacterium]|nr:lipopolysaccharide assembly protein LapB [Gammaproteobacteria bacterium]
MNSLWMLLLPVAAASGWLASIRHRKRSVTFASDYYLGLRHLFNEEPDKAIDVFIDLLSVDKETIDTHLALGTLFRNRGEVNRAIRIHDNLVARSELSKKQRLYALFELAHDYMHAGVLDRAEELFLEVLNLDNKSAGANKALMTIYEQQKDWHKAIKFAKKLPKLQRRSMTAAIANYYCELGDPEAALEIDKNCVRASILLGNKQVQCGQYKNAIFSYKNILSQDADFIAEIIDSLAICYANLRNEKAFDKYLYECLKKAPRISILIAISENIRKTEGDFAAIDFMTEQLSRCPSLHGLLYITELYVNNSDITTRKRLQSLLDTMHILLRAKPAYRCSRCGFSAKTLYWHCPSCREWNSLKPIYGLDGN